MVRSMKKWPASLLFIAFAMLGAPLQAAPPPPAKVYTVNPGDQLEVYVWGEPRLQRQIRVLPDGSFSFPLVGRVIAQGLSPEQIEATITKGLASQYNGAPPQVTVSVTNPVGYVFSVVGHVRGASTFTPGRYVNVMEAIAMAGGPDEFANLDNVTIIHKTDKGLVAQRVRLGGIMKGNISESLASSIPQIETGDTVIVP